MRVGMGYDVHRLVEDRPLILGGVEIPYEKAGAEKPESAAPKPPQWVSIASCVPSILLLCRYYTLPRRPPQFGKMDKNYVNFCEIFSLT